MAGKSASVLPFCFNIKLDLFIRKHCRLRRYNPYYVLRLSQKCSPTLTFVPFVETLISTQLINGQVVIQLNHLVRLYDRYRYYLPAYPPANITQTILEFLRGIFFMKKGKTLKNICAFINRI